MNFLRGTSYAVIYSKRPVTLERRLRHQHFIASYLQTDRGIRLRHWQFLLPGLLAGRGFLLRWLLDFLRFGFGRGGLVSAVSLSAFILAHLG